MSAYSNQVVRFRFRFGSDQQNDFFVEGWFLDDLLVTPQSGTNVWMTLSPTQGWVVAGTASNITLSFDGSGMTNGMSRVQKLAVYANDPIHPTNR